MSSAKPDKLAAWVSQATNLLHEKKYAETRRLCLKILAKEPASIATLHILQNVEHELGDRARSLQLLRRLRQLAPGDASIAATLGTALGKAGEHEAAIQALQNAIQLDPLMAPAFFSLEKIYERTNPADGIAYFGELHQRLPSLVTPLINLSRLNSAHGSLRDARLFAEKALSQEPQLWQEQSLQARYWLARVNLLEKNYAAAERLFHECLASPDINPTNHDILSEILADTKMIAQLAPALHLAQPANNATASFRDAWEMTVAETINAQLAEPPIEEAIIFFHVDWKSDHPFLNTSASGGVDYRGTLVAACHAARHAYPDASIIVLTNPASEMDYLPDGVKVVRVDADASQMMFSRMRAYRALVMTKKLKGPALFLDTDIYLNRSLSPLFDGSFDVAFTYRNVPGFWHMPINEGMILAADGQSDKLAQFFGESLALYEWLAQQPCVPQRYGFDIRMWRGGQLSLGALADWNVPPHAAKDQTIRNVRYRFLPCAEFNYPALPDDTPAFLKKKWAIHFKGGVAKTMIASYQKAWRN